MYAKVLVTQNMITQKLHQRYIWSHKICTWQHGWTQ